MNRLVAETDLEERPGNRILERKAGFSTLRQPGFSTHGGEKNHLTIWKMIVRTYQITAKVIHLFECPFLNLNGSKLTGNIAARHSAAAAPRPCRRRPAVNARCSCQHAAAW